MYSRKLQRDTPGEFIYIYIYSMVSCVTRPETCGEKYK